mmetsp:Transcript_34799/g.81939  ORF Transcript_34799/g.81939 Transcript_34799/m.81939 type:complete len:251 (+) Transcript_34799:2478-3230(+)
MFEAISKETVRSAQDPVDGMCVSCPTVMCEALTCTCMSDTSQMPLCDSGHVLPGIRPVFITTPPAGWSIRTHPSTVSARCWLSDRRSRNRHPALTLGFAASGGDRQVAGVVQQLMASVVENPANDTETAESDLKRAAVPTAQGFSSSQCFTRLSQRSSCGTADVAGTLNDGPLRMVLGVKGSLNAVDGTEIMGRIPTRGEASAFWRSTSAVSTHGLSALLTSCPKRQHPVNFANHGLAGDPSRPSSLGVG